MRHDKLTTKLQEALSDAQSLATITPAWNRFTC